MKKFVASIVMALLVLLTPVATFAHVTVTPGEAKVGERTTFFVNVPTEKDIPTTQVRIVVPEQLKSVSPFLKTGWNIELVKEGTGDSERVKEVIWSGGTIASDFRDEFKFRSQVPAEETELQWKAYQTYQDGTVVAWDQAEEKDVQDNEAENTSGPLSVTKVTNDKTEDDVINIEKRDIETKQLRDRSNIALGVSVVAVGASLITIAIRKK